MDAVETITDDATGITVSVYVDEYPTNPRDDGDIWAASLTQLSRDYTQPDDMHDTRIIEAWSRGYDWRASGSRGSGHGYAPDVEIVERYARAFLGAVAVAWWDDPRGSSRIFGYVTAERAAELGVTDAQAALDGEMAEYVAWCEGDVYVIECDGDMIGGYYGDEYAMTAAREMLADAVAARHAERAELYRALVNAS